MITLKILGIKDYHQTDSILDNLKMIIKTNKLNINLQEVNDIEEFIRFQVSAVPAIVINGNIYNQDQISDYNNLLSILLFHQKNKRHS